MKGAASTIGAMQLSQALGDTGRYGALALALTLALTLALALALASAVAPRPSP